MTSSEGKAQDEEKSGGSIVPAALAGIGILVVAGIFIFGGGDDDKESEKDATAEKAKSKGGKRDARGGVEARRADEPTAPERRTPKLNPRLAGKLPTGGMAPERAPKKQEPTSFASVEEERDYWRGRVEDAERMVEMRQRAVERMPRLEEQMRNGLNPESDLKDLERRKTIVNENLERDTAKLAEAKAKLEQLGG